MMVPSAKVAAALKVSPAPLTLQWPGGRLSIVSVNVVPKRQIKNGFTAIVAIPEAEGLLACFSQKVQLVAGPQLGTEELTFGLDHRRMMLEFEIDFMLKSASLDWHPGYAFVTKYGLADELIILGVAALEQELWSGHPHGEDYWKNLVSILAARFLLNHRAQVGPAPLRGGLSAKRLRTCLSHIEENLHRDVTSEELATLAGLSEPHLRKAFTRSVGQPPFRYLRKRRIERSKQLLERRGLSIAEVALECGYSSQSHFTTAFKAETATTPAAFRSNSGSDEPTEEQRLAMG